jgi:hypothetical protein
VSDCRAVDDVDTSSPPNCGITSLGAVTGWAMAPSSSTPYVANVSDVDGVYTGSDTVAESARSPLTAVTRSAARPTSSAASGKRTSTRSAAGTVTRNPVAASAPRLADSTTTSASSGASVWFCTTTGSSKRSPKLRKRGALGRTINGSSAVTLASAVPNCWVPAAATTITR